MQGADSLLHTHCSLPLPPPSCLSFVPQLYGKPIRVNKAASDKNSQDVGANLFIGNLDPDVDEKVRCARCACCAPLC